MRLVIVGSGAVASAYGCLLQPYCSHLSLLSMTRRSFPSHEVVLHVKAGMLSLKCMMTGQKDQDVSNRRTTGKKPRDAANGTRRRSNTSRRSRVARIGCRIPLVGFSDWHNVVCNAECALVCCKAHEAVAAVNTLFSHNAALSVVLLCNGIPSLIPDLLKVVKEKHIALHRLHLGVTTIGVAPAPLASNNKPKCRKSAKINKFEKGNVQQSEKQEFVLASLGNIRIGTLAPLTNDASLRGGLPLSSLEKSMENAGIPVTVEPSPSHLFNVLWSKLAVNCCINPLATIHNCSNGKLLFDVPSFPIISSFVCKEVHDLAASHWKDLQNLLKEIEPARSSVGDCEQQQHNCPKGAEEKRCVEECISSVPLPSITELVDRVMEVAMRTSANTCSTLADIQKLSLRKRQCLTEKGEELRPEHVQDLGSYHVKRLQSSSELTTSKEESSLSRDIVGGKRKKKRPTEMDFLNGFVRKSCGLEGEANIQMNACTRGSSSSKFSYSEAGAACVNGLLDDAVRALELDCECRDREGKSEGFKKLKSFLT